jgi:hypothetical protein
MKKEITNDLGTILYQEKETTDWKNRNLFRIMTNIDVVILDGECLTIAVSGLSKDEKKRFETDGDKIRFHKTKDSYEPMIALSEHSGVESFDLTRGQATLVVNKDDVSGTAFKNTNVEKPRLKVTIIMPKNNGIVVEMKGDGVLESWAQHRFIRFTMSESGKATFHGLVKRIEGQVTASSQIYVKKLLGELRLSAVHDAIAKVKGIFSLVSVTTRDDAKITTFGKCAQDYYIQAQLGDTGISHKGKISGKLIIKDVAGVFSPMV